METVDLQYPATVEDALNAKPADWNTTKHGGRSFARVLDFVSFVAADSMTDPGSRDPAGTDVALERQWDGRGVWIEQKANDARALSVFTVANVAKWIDDLSKRGLSSGTRNRNLTAVSVLWKRAHRRGLLPAPPTGLYEREPKGRRRVLSAEEEPRLLEALAEPYRSLAAFLLASGLRVGEALALRWEDCGAYATNTWTVSVRDSKNGDARVVPGVQFRHSIADGYRASGPFANISHSAFNHAFRAAKAAIGLERDAEFVPHMLRHTYATRLVVKGVPLAVVARLMGHRTVRTTMRYSHVSDQDAAEWIRKVNGG